MSDPDFKWVFLEMSKVIKSDIFYPGPSHIIIYCYLQFLIDSATNLVQLFSRFPVLVDN